MAYALKLRKYALLLWAPTVFVISAVATTLIKASVDATTKEGKVNLSVWPWVYDFSTWFSIHWGGLLGWVVAATLAMMMVLAYRDERRLRAARILEHYALHILWLRAIALRPESTRAELKEAIVSLHQDRGDLLNFTPSVFSQATADAFRAPAILGLTTARLLVEGLSNQGDREILLASADHILDAVESKWIAYKGVEAPTP